MHFLETNSAASVPYGSPFSDGLRALRGALTPAGNEGYEQIREARGEPLRTSVKD